MFKGYFILWNTFEKTNAKFYDWQVHNVISKSSITKIGQ